MYDGKGHTKQKRDSTENMCETECVVGSHPAVYLPFFIFHSLHLTFTDEVPTVCKQWTHTKVKKV